MMALQINGDAEFWHARSELTYIHDYARACQVSPWALLSVVLARVCAAVPPHVATQPLYGNAPGTLNLFVAVLGGSGDGKGLTERMARAAARHQKRHHGAAGVRRGHPGLVRHTRNTGRGWQKNRHQVCQSASFALRAGNHLVGRFRQTTWLHAHPHADKRMQRRSVGRIQQKRGKPSHGARTRLSHRADYRRPTP